MERLNLNLPSAAREVLKRLARQATTTEGELARRLMLDALARAERQELIERAVRAGTRERRARDLQILNALEKWRP